MQLAPQPIDDSATAHFAYAGGMRGVAQTITVMRAMVNDYKLDPRIRQAAVNIIYNLPSKIDAAEAEAIFDFVRDSIRYTKDICDVETISTPDRTLQTRIGDCDDKSVLLATLLESVGYATRFVVAGYFIPGNVEHVYLQVWLDGQWVDADATEPHPLGWAPPGAVAMYYEGA
jgi:transglutaminase-like putative cysteine protease